MSRPHDQDRNQDATCYVGNLDDRASDSLVWELMLQAGPIINVHLPKDRVTSAHQGYGFAEYQTEADAEYACKIMNGIKLFGKPLRINKASSDRKQIDIGANLFVGNLDAGVDERLLYDTFSAFGRVLGVPKVSRDPVTNEPKGYGFVSFDSFEAADAAIESLANQFLLNKPLSIDYAFKKDSKGGERHGTAAERLLAAQARKNNALPPIQPGLGARPQQGGYAQRQTQQQEQQQGQGQQQQQQQQQQAPSQQPPPPPPSIPQYTGPPPSMGGPGAPPPPPPPGMPVMGMQGGYPQQGQGFPPPPPPTAPMGQPPMHMYQGPPPQPPQQAPNGHYQQHY